MSMKICLSRSSPRGQRTQYRLYRKLYPDEATAFCWVLIKFTHSVTTYHYYLSIIYKGACAGISIEGGLNLLLLLLLLSDLHNFGSCWFPIVVPDVGVDGRGQTKPGQVGHHQVTGSLVDWAECKDAGSNCAGHGTNIQESLEREIENYKCQV